MIDIHVYDDPAALLPAPPAVRPWLIGESNPYGADPYYALYPDPPGCTGHRLCKLILQLDPDEYLERFVRKNLLALGPGRRWSLPAAREAAEEIVRISAGAPLVFLGKKVCDAFSVPFEPFTAFGQRGVTRSGVILPHPSGLSRLWSKEAFGRAGALVLELLTEPAA